MSCPACGLTQYRLLRFSIKPNEWEPSRPIEYEEDSHAIALEMGSTASTTVCGRQTAGSTTYPGNKCAADMALMVTCEACCEGMAG